MESNWKANALGNRYYEDDEDWVNHSFGHSTASNAAIMREEVTNTMVTGDRAELQTDLETIEHKNFQPSFKKVISSMRKKWRNTLSSESSNCVAQKKCCMKLTRIENRNYVFLKTKQCLMLNISRVQRRAELISTIGSSGRFYFDERQVRNQFPCMAFYSSNDLQRASACLSHQLYLSVLLAKTTANNAQTIYKAARTSNGQNSP